LALFGAIMLALYQRQTTGRGCKVSTSLMATGAWSNSCQIQAAMLGAVFPPRRTRVTSLNPLVNQYQTRDGLRFMLCCLDTKHDWGRICRAISRTELIGDPRYATAEARFEHGEEVVAILDQAFATKEMAEWQRLFDEHSVIWGPIPKIDRVAADDQMKANGVFTSFDHPQLGSVPTVNNPINVNGVVKKKPKMAPEIGQHSIEILSALGYEQEAIEQLIQREVIATTTP
jgi:crotonobetainyl-CoA:carnitine CoA-transferase CaiB-like acyl-CoA transferase